MKLTLIFLVVAFSIAHGLVVPAKPSPMPHKPDQHKPVVFNETASLTQQCPHLCAWFCRVDGLCAIHYRNLCPHERQKRAVGVQGRNIPLPADMDYYDLDDNDYLTLTELSLALKVSTSAVSRMFQLADRNRNGVISEWEFKRAPWAFERKNNVHTINCPGTGGGKITVINQHSHESAESNEWGWN
ncbi:EF-hand calcium-binding domain-containing protein 1-like [Tubulanus polymorphus]|uniref:EF-hand calcium-binding domain-containing protein 1-like n=1 Tax=Tubulanus polymorphus TaxID=672921 RepID=UPI003DA5BAB5